MASRDDLRWHVGVPAPGGDPPGAVVVETRSHTGDFSEEDFCSEDFDTSRLEIELSGERTVSFNSVVDRVVEFWSRFFEENGIER